MSNFSIDFLLRGSTSRQQKRPQSTTLSDSDSPGVEEWGVRLESGRLWRKFHALDTEMIVTRSGRRMFPTLKYSISGLSHARNYSLMVDFMCVDRRRYRYSFHQSKWVVAGLGEAELPSRLHVHHDSPSSGDHWCKQPVEFDRIKLTNNQLDRNGHVIVNSMHRYFPRLHIVEHSHDKEEGGGENRRSFTFPETQFMAVTAYQNHRITELKIASNPFAKGFRESELEQLRRASTSLLLSTNLVAASPRENSTSQTALAQLYG